MLDADLDASPLFHLYEEERTRRCRRRACTAAATLGALTALVAAALGVGFLVQGYG